MLIIVTGVRLNSGRKSRVTAPAAGKAGGMHRSTGDACPQTKSKTVHCGPHNRSLSLIVVRSDAETASKGLRLWRPPNVEYEKSVG